MKRPKAAVLFRMSTTMVAGRRGRLSAQIRAGRGHYSCMAAPLADERTRNIHGRPAWVPGEDAPQRPRPAAPVIHGAPMQPRIQVALGNGQLTPAVWVGVDRDEESVCGRHAEPRRPVQHSGTGATIEPGVYALGEAAYRLLIEHRCANPTCTARTRRGCRCHRWCEGFHLPGDPRGWCDPRCGSGCCLRRRFARAPRCRRTWCR